MPKNTSALAAVILASLLLAATPAFAQRTGGQTGQIYNADGSPSTGGEPAPIVTEIVIPGTPDNPDEPGTGRLIDLAQYLGIVYTFLMGIVGILAAVMIVIGGFQYLTSAGDSGKIAAAKTRIINAMIGELLALGAFTILNTINPALLKLKVPSIGSVRTEIAFLPFCDTLAKTYGISEDQVTRASQNVAGPAKGMNCGEAGFIMSKLKNSDGGTTDNRIWCIWRGSKEYGASQRAKGQDVNDYGNYDDTSIMEGHVFGADTEYHALSVCAPVGGIPQSQMNEEYAQHGHIVTRLAYDQSCNRITEGAVRKLMWPQGDESCQYWQNVANNGDPKDYTFTSSKRGIIYDTRNGTGDMYYCGYSANHKRCIYVPIKCGSIGECDDYDDMKMKYCQFVSGGEECHTSQTLGTSWGTQAGNAAHLIPVCDADPCERASKGCYVSGLAGTRNTLVGSISSKIRVVGRIITGGLAGGISCDAI